MADLETLTIRIKANATTAYKAINNLAQSFNNLSASIAKIETGKLNDLANGLTTLNTAIKSANSIARATDYNKIVSNIAKFDGINTSRLGEVANTVVSLANAFAGLSSATEATKTIGSLAKAINQLGGVKAEAAIANLPRLEQALAHLLTSFSQLPEINQSVIDFVTSLGNLAAQGSHVGPATKSIGNALESFGTSATRARRRSHSLASTIGTLYAKFWLLMRAARGLKSAFTDAADYLEAYNYFEVTANKIGKDTFAKAGEGSAEQYAEAFVSTMQEKLKKMSGLELDLENRLIKTTNAKSLGLNLTELTQYQASIASITNAMGNSQEIAQSTAKAFSMLAGDMGSLKNLDFEQVAQNLQSALTGQARALYKYGIDLTNATLEQYAYNNGITKSVSEMTQAEKAQLRLLAILDQSKVAWGDLANTINSPSNQLRMLQNNLKEVGTVMGQLFIPIMSQALPVLNGLSIAIKQLLVDIAELLGIKLDLDSFGQFGEDIDDDIESMEELNAAVKETKKGIRDFDELKVIADNKKGSGVGDQIDLTKQIIDATNEYEKVWDAAYERMTNKASEIAGYISAAFEPIKTIIEDFHIGNFFKAGEDVSNLVISIFDFVSDAISQVDWYGLGVKVAEFLSGIKWDEILKSLAGLVWSAIQAAFNAWRGSFSVMPFETALITAFALLKFTGLGDTVTNALSKTIASSLKSKGITSASLAKFGLGAIAIGLSVSMTIDNIKDVKAGKYAAFSAQSLFKSAISSLLAGAGLTSIAAAFGAGHLGLIFGATVGISLLFNVIMTKINDPTPYDETETQKQMREWVEKTHMDNVEILANITIKDQDVNVQIDNISTYAQKVADLTERYSELTDAEKAELKFYSDELIKLVPDVAGSIDEITGAYKGSREELEKLIKTQERQIKMEAYHEQMVELQKRKVEIENQPEYEYLKGKVDTYNNLVETNKQRLSAYYSEDEINKIIAMSEEEFKNFDFENASAKKHAKNLRSDIELYEQYVEKLKPISGDLEEINSKIDYYMSQYSEELMEATKVTGKSIGDMEDGFKNTKLPRNVESTMDKVNDQISHGQTVSTANMNKMFRSIDQAFYGLPTGEIPADVKATMEAIKQAIIDDSPEIVNLMEQLKLQMLSAFENTKTFASGEIAYNPKGVVTRIDQAFNSIQAALETGAKPGTSTLEEYISELFGGNVPKEVDNSLKKLANTIDKGEGKQAVLGAVSDLKNVLREESWDAGMYIMLGAEGGIFNGVGYVENAVNYGLVYIPTTTAQKGLEEKSPSRVFRRIGEYIPMGAALGIEDGIPNLKSAVQGMVSVITSTFGNVRYNIPDLGIGSVNSQKSFNYGSMDSNNGFMSQMINMANMAANGATEVVFRVEGDPYGIFKVVREENDKYRNRTQRSAF